MTKMLRKIDGWRFEVPLAALLALSSGFMVFVMPARILSAVPGAIRLGALFQPVAAAVAAVLGGLLALALMIGAGRRPRRAAAETADADADIDVAPMPAPVAEESVAPPVAEPTVVRVRRADAHPDAPPRAPILATRDLGQPFMDFEPAPAAPAIAPDIAEADFVELADTVDEAPAVPVPPRPAPAPRPERQSIADMMARLDAGMMRRAGPALPPRDARPALRDALAELNRLAARRG
jgi:hypothetical protein